MKHSSLITHAGYLKEESNCTSIQTFVGSRATYIYLNRFFQNDRWKERHSEGNLSCLKHPSLITHPGNLKEDRNCTSIQTFVDLRAAGSYLNSFLLNDKGDSHLKT